MSTRCTAKVGSCHSSRNAERPWHRHRTDCNARAPFTTSVHTRPAVFVVPTRPSDRKLAELCDCSWSIGAWSAGSVRSNRPPTNDHTVASVDRNGFTIMNCQEGETGGQRQRMRQVVPLGDCAHRKGPVIRGHVRATTSPAVSVRPKRKAATEHVEWRPLDACETTSLCRQSLG